MSRFIWLGSTDLGLRFKHSVLEDLSSEQLKYENSQLIKMLIFELENTGKVEMIFSFFKMREH